MNANAASHRNNTIGLTLAALVAASLFLAPLATAAPAPSSAGPEQAPPAVEPLPETTFTAAQIQKKLDQPVEPMVVDNEPLLKVIATLEGDQQWIDLPGSTLSFLPYGEETTVSLRVSKAAGQQATVRMVLDAVLSPLSLEWRIIENRQGKAVLRIVPQGALARIGRRATIEEIQLLHTLRHTQIDSLTTPLPQQIGQALKRPITLQFNLEGLQPSEAYEKFRRSVSGLPKASAAALLDQFVTQGPWTWRVDGNSIIVLNKSKQVLHQLRRHVSVDWQDKPLEQALVQLGNAAGVLVQFQPGVLENIEQSSRRITWQTPDESILQIVETLTARTGLAYEIREESIHVFSPRGRGPIDPVIGFVSVPSRTGQYNYQFLIRKSMVPPEAQPAVEAQIKTAVERMVRELAETGFVPPENRAP